MTGLEQYKELQEETLKYYEELLEKPEIKNKKGLKEDISRCKIKIKKCDYEECNHLWVSIPTEDEDEDRLQGCVKCGITNSFIPKFEKMYRKLSEDEKASFEYIMKWSIRNIPSTDTALWCDLELGMAIYRKLKAAHPEATDEQISDYLSYALWKMRTKDQSEKRTAGRVKRLELKPDFNAWNKEFEED